MNFRELNSMPKLSEKSNLSKMVSDYVIEKIISGEFYPSMRLVERDLAETLNVSRVPVREAFTTLINDAWVKKDKKGKVSVSRITEKDVREIFQLREGIEGIAAREAARLIDNHKLKLLSRELKILNKHDRKEYIALDSESRTTHKNADKHFHQIIIDTAGNERIKKIFSSVVLQSQSFFYLREASFRLGIDSLIFQELVSHQSIYDALASHDEELAETLMRQHLRRGCEAIIKVKQFFGIQ
ncbi:MAG: GntR family transcriptional regulator [Spirochaetota bacterium]